MRPFRYWSELAVVGGAMLVVALVGHRRLGAWLRGFFSAGEGSARLLLHDGHGLSSARLRELIVGRPKAYVAATFGPPRTAVLRHAVPRRTAYWRGDTWYYAIDTSDQTAMAVRFDQNIACAVDFFQSPSFEE